MTTADQTTPATTLTAAEAYRVLGIYGLPVEENDPDEDYLIYAHGRKYEDPTFTFKQLWDGCTNVYHLLNILLTVASALSDSQSELERKEALICRDGWFFAMGVIMQSADDEENAVKVLSRMWIVRGRTKLSRSQIDKACDVVSVRGLGRKTICNRVRAGINYPALESALNP